MPRLSSMESGTTSTPVINTQSKAELPREEVRSKLELILRMLISELNSLLTSPRLLRTLLSHMDTRPNGIQSLTLF